MDVSDDESGARGRGRAQGAAGDGGDSGGAPFSHVRCGTANLARDPSPKRLHPAVDGAYY